MREMLHNRGPASRPRPTLSRLGLGQVRQASGAPVQALSVGGIERQPQEMLHSRGPQSRPRPTYTKTGIGQVKQVRGNPISWGLDCIGQCWPFLTLRGGQDPASQALREATADNLRPKQVRLLSRGVLGIFEKAGGSGGLPQAFSTGVPMPEEEAVSTTDSTAPADEGGSLAPAPLCPEGLVFVPLGQGRFKCAVPFGR